MAQPHHILQRMHRQQGGAAILFVLCLPVFLGFAALAVDLARIHLTKVELQNAADAAALAGVLSLGDTEPPAGLPDKPYNWTAATAAALEVARRNLVDGSQIRDALVEAGYWNLQNPALGLRPEGTPGVPDAGDLPAIRVTAERSGTRNDGPLQLFFAPVLGIAERDIRASAIAVLPAAGGGTGMFPMVISSCMFNHFWDFETRSPKLDPATGRPYLLDIGSIYFGGCYSGTWTTFSSTDNSAQAVKQLISQGNPSNLEIGDVTWIQTGVEDALYRAVPEDKDVAVLVVDHVQVNSFQPIVAIAGFHISGTVKVNGKSYVQGHFVQNVSIGTTNPGTGNGLPLGAYAPPVLVN